jgi:hypothetical protein
LPALTGSFLHWVWRQNIFCSLFTIHKPSMVSRYPKNRHTNALIGNLKSSTIWP